MGSSSCSVVGRSLYSYFFLFFLFDGFRFTLNQRQVIYWGPRLIDNFSYYRRLGNKHEDFMPIALEKFEYQIKKLVKALKKNQEMYFYCIQIVKLLEYNKNTFLGSGNPLEPPIKLGIVCKT